MCRTVGLRILLAALLAAGAGVLVGPARATDLSPFTLGALRRDGVIIPFAAWDGSRFVNRWPAAGRREDVPISVAGSPKSWWLDGRPLSYWTAWPLRGDSQVVYVKSPTNLTVQCQAQIGLQTDYRSVEPAAPAAMQPFPKDGLATSGDVLVEPVAIIGATSPEWTAIAADVASRVGDAETRLLAENPRVLPIPEAQRRKRPFTLEVLFRSAGPQPGTTLLYFEGTKRYGRSEGSARITILSTQEPLTYAVGWVLLAPQSPPRITESITFSDSRREGLLYTLALGAFRIEGRLHWAVQRAGWGFERYDIVDFTGPDPKNAFSTSGGSCR